MLINADHAERVAIDTNNIPWQPSPLPGVERKMLERNGAEQARATSIVRYAPGARFSQHNHPRGEEILVLEGTFADELGEYPAGTYLRNPHNSVHAPYSPDGCVLLVKLRYQDPADSQRVVIDTHSAAWRPGLEEGLTVLPLAEFATEHTALVRWQPGTHFQPHRHYGGEEIFVLDGVFQDEFGDYPAGTWLRSPHMSQHQPFSEPGCLIFVKVGHLEG
ncbi:cupin domain-containing protein [Thermithiobacillus plumbiphilus]|uniref:Cupin domain-containing protein n=1 Tax=Thermithiobacillus plumbiphilus TaxID=1729899 RepID=A0ABU9D9U1_9PROT